VEQSSQCVVAVKARRRFSSSGIYWHPGVIVTADETIKRNDDITLTLSDGRTLPATLAGRDVSTDVAVLKILDVELPTAQIRDTASLKVGYLMLSVGRSTENGIMDKSPTINEGDSQ
jgi:S1-C subfamily serine protease